MTNLCLSKNKKYNFPKNIEIISHNEHFIILAVEAGRWIIAKNVEEVEMFQCFQSGLSIAEVLKRWPKQQSKVLRFISEIEGRHFDAPVLAIEDAAGAFSTRIYLTRRCNMRCPHCFLSAGRALENELSETEVLNLIKLIARRGCSKIILTGGEPLLHPGFGKIVRACKNNGMTVQVLSNGVLWTRKMLQFAADIDEAQISIDGFDEQSNAPIRGEGNFSRAMKTVEELLSRGVFVNLSVTPPPHQFELCYEQYLNFARQCLLRFDTPNFEVVFTDELYDGREGRIEDVQKEKYAKLVHQIHEDIYRDYEYKVFVRKHSNNAMCMNCGFANLTVDSNGDVYYCTRIMETLKQGNVRTMPIVDILKRRRCARIATSVKYVVPCKDCNLRFVCGGGCRLSKFSGLKDLVNVDVAHSIQIARECSPDIRSKILDFMLAADEILCY